MTEVPSLVNNSLEDDRKPIPEDLDHRREKDMRREDEINARLDELFKAWHAVENIADRDERYRKQDPIEEEIIELFHEQQAIWKAERKAS